MYNKYIAKLFIILLLPAFDTCGREKSRRGL